MAKVKKSNVNNTINIKSLPVQCHIGASKFVNDDWGTIAFSIPRNQIQNKFANMELRYNFIYFLFGYENSKEVVYVGQAKKRNDGESVLARLREHDQSITEKYRDKWEWIIAVTNKDDAWGLDDLNALEHAFYNEIPAEQNLNGNNPNSGGADYEAYIDKINQIKSLITAIGFNIFSDEETAEKIQVTSEVNEYTIVEDLQNGMARIPEIVTPQKVVKAMVDMLPKAVWNSQTKFLDPACKGGEYLREIYDRLMDCELLQSEFPNAIERSNHILKNQIYGIALSQVSLERTTKKLLGEDRNIRVIPDYINKLKGINLGSRPDGSQNNILDILNKEFGKEMKFDVVIGNPPYQENIASTDGNKSLSKQLFPTFIMKAIQIADIVTFITPSRWFTAEAQDGSFPKLRQFIKANNHISEICNYTDASEIFMGTMIKGGVNYFLYKKDFTGDVHFVSIHGIEKTESVRPLFINNMDIILFDEMHIQFIEHLNKIGYKSMTTITTGRNPFGIQGKDSNVFEIIANSEKEDAKLLCRGGEVTAIDSDFITRGRDILGSYKVIISKSAGDPANDKKVIGKPYVAGPMCACTDTFITIGKFNDVNEAGNLGKYLQTKFVRYAISIMKMSQNTYQIVYEFVPIQDFTNQSDIDWSQSIADIDQQLYKKYNLTQEEIDYIEATIKPMN